MADNQPTREQWRPVVGYEGKYEVSDLGRVRSMERVVNRPHRGPHRVGTRVLKARIAHHGHHYVTLFGDTKKDRRHFGVHRLLLAAFVGPCPDGMEACHNDGDPANNHISNLRWDTRESNMQDKLRHGTDWNKNKTHCPQGHPYSIENTYTPPSRPTERMCRACRAANDRRRKVRLKSDRVVA